MALDEALLESAEAEQIATLRFYQWREPTLSLGYFQCYADRQLHEASSQCAIVRRASGGGAILHDRELTYSIAMPNSHPLASRAEVLYLAAHESLTKVLSELGVTATLRQCRSDRCQEKNSSVEPFLCFQRAADGDVLMGSYKIAGSAQRRRKGAVLQHGSVLLARSKCAPELPGISDLAGVSIGVEQLLQRWSIRLLQRLDLPLGKPQTPLPQSIAARAEEIAQAKFASPDWAQRR